MTFQFIEFCVLFKIEPWQSVRLFSSTCCSSELVSFQLSLRAQIWLSHFSSCSWISFSVSFEIKFSIFSNLFCSQFSSGHSVIRFIVHGDSCKRIHLPPLIAVAMHSTAFLLRQWLTIEYTVFTSSTMIYSTVTTVAERWLRCRLTWFAHRQASNCVPVTSVYCCPVLQHSVACWLRCFAGWLAPSWLGCWFACCSPFRRHASVDMGGARAVAAALADTLRFLVFRFLATGACD